MKTRLLPLFTLCGVVASSGFAARAIESNPDRPSDTASAVPASAAPQFSGRINDVVSLTKSGVDQSIVLAFIKASPGPFEPTADEIIKLRDMGISTPVLTAMLERGGQVREQSRAAAVAAAPDQSTANPNQAPVISATPPSTYAGADYSTQPASTVTYIGGGDYGYSFPYYPVYYSGWYSTAFFYPFPCWYNGIYYSHGCYFPHGGFIHDGFHLHDGFHGGSHGDVHGGIHAGGVGIHGGVSDGFHGGASGGFHGGVSGGFHGGVDGSVHAGVPGGGIHSMPVGGGVGRMPVGGGIGRMPVGGGVGSMPVGGRVGGMSVGGGMRSAPSGGGFHGGVSGGFRSGGGGGGFHGGGGMHR